MHVQYFKKIRSDLIILSIALFSFPLTDRIVYYRQHFTLTVQYACYCHEA